MNSYPPELLVQLAPVMFVAGLDTPVAAPAPPPASQTPATVTAKSQDPFAVLTVRLRDALFAQRKVAIWQPEKAKSFQVILVDKDVRFPPRKVSLNDAHAHSPLSPLTPSSPLHPDGLIAPIWIRKHTTLVPSVFVLFIRIFDLPQMSPRSPLDAVDSDKERDRDQEERRRDVELAGYIAARKKLTNERGIKLTVVLLASRRMLDDPSLDARLTFIRKQSGLDARAALFVLSPVSQAELGDFVQSLQQALYEPAVEYYTTHSKRVRRKRNRHTQAISTYSNLSPMGASGSARPLRPEGWTVRYEYKMACFAEFRGEDEVALKHYQDAYEVLAVMFGSIAILPPRTKRWAEAKVLADCMNIKIVKLYLYNNEHSLALSHHTTHIRKFGDLSRSWSIGEDTFEYWSWIARQYRILAELMEQGSLSTLSLPSHQPSSFNIALEAMLASYSASRGSAPVLEVDGLRSLGSNPSHALQHPGFYYYMAARCTELRRERFLISLEAESADNVASSPGFANEKKVDHLVIILELYTKAYELFKKYSPPSPPSQSQARLTLWIAYRIGQTYYDSGKFDMAIRFFERIAKTYRREHWDSMLRPLLTTWYACVKQLGDVELSIKLLIEMMGHGIVEADEPGSLQDDLLAVLKSTVPSNPDEPLVIDANEAEPLFDCNIVFWQSQAKVGDPSAFQLHVTAPADILISDIPFSTLDITFSGDLGPITLQHVDEESPLSNVQVINLGTLGEDARTMDANLRWQPGSVLVVTGTMVSDSPVVLKVTRLLFSLVQDSWNIQIPIDPSRRRTGPYASIPTNKWLASLSPLRYIEVKKEGASSVQVSHRSHVVAVDVSHTAPACIDEDYPLTIEVTNNDEQELEIIVDVLLQPTELDDAVNTISVGDELSSGLIKGIPFGTLLPGVSSVKTLHLMSTGGAGDRVLDISLQSRSTKDLPTEAEERIEDVSEILLTIVVPTVALLSLSQNVVYRRSMGQRLGLNDLRAYEEDFWDDGEAGEVEINITLECTGPWSFELESVEFRRQDNEQARVLHTSADYEGGAFPDEYFPGDQYSAWCLASLSPKEMPLAQPIPSLGDYVIKWRRIKEDGSRGPQATTSVASPKLQPPTDGLIALLNVPSVARLHQSIPLTLTIRNNHPTRAANITVYVEPDPSDAFVIAGLRNGQVPILLPGAEEQILWKLIPIECGQVILPKIKALDRRQMVQEAEHPGSLVRIVDVRTDDRWGADGVGDGKEVGTERKDVLGTVLVLP